MHESASKFPRLMSRELPGLRYAALRTLTLAAALFTTIGTAHAADFSVSSPTLQDGGSISLEQVQCGGRNMSPALEWSNAPAGTKSFAVSVYDPDAPTLSGWWHWQVYNIPAGTTGLPANAGDPAANLIPAGSVQNVNDGGKPGFAGACPPKGDKAHRYIFSVYAMPDEVIKVPTTASNAMVGFNLVRRSLARASITVTYGRE